VHEPWINSARIVWGRGEYDRLIVDGRELFLTNVSSVKADVRLAGLRRRRVARARSYYCVNTQSARIPLREITRGDKMRKIKIAVRIFIFDPDSIARERERERKKGINPLCRYDRSSDLRRPFLSNQGANQAWNSAALRTWSRGDRLPFSQRGLIYFVRAPRDSPLRTIADCRTGMSETETTAVRRKLVSLWMSKYKTRAQGCVAWARLSR